MTRNSGPEWNAYMRDYKRRRKENGGAPLGKPPIFRIEKPTSDDIEKAKDSPWYSGYTYGREKEHHLLRERSVLGRLKFLITGMALALLITACGQRPTGPVDTKDNGDFSEQRVTLQDGRTVLCLFWVSGQFSQTNTSGLSCDWGNAK